jgi:hypothetical protein
MMMRAIEAGGLSCVYDTSGDARRNAESAIPDYVPNPHGFYEANAFQTINRTTLRGRALKVIHGNACLLSAGERYRAVFMRRDPREIERSYRSVAGREMHPAARAIHGDYATLVAREITELQRLSADVIVLDYAAVVAEPLGQLARLDGWPIDVPAAAAVVDPALYRHRAGRAA